MTTIYYNKRLLTTIGILILFFTNGLAQKDPNDLQLSENTMGLNNKPTAQFGKAAIGTSDLYTGMATYNIPLFELKSHKLKVPISLNYASGGVKVGETGGWLGMSWR